MKSNFNKSPVVKLKGNHDCYQGWSQIASKMREDLIQSSAGKRILVVECYHGVFEDEILAGLSPVLNADLVISTTDAFKDESQIAKMVYPDVTDDRVFGRMTSLTIEDYFDGSRLEKVRATIAELEVGLVLIIGVGASLIAQRCDLLVYADMARWEIQMRMRRHEISSIGVANSQSDWPRIYKQGFFVDWRICDVLKRNLLDKIDWVLDTNTKQQPQMISGTAMKKTAFSWMLEG